MSGIYTSQHTGTEIDEAVAAHNRVVSESEKETLLPSDFPQDKIFILSDNNSLYRSEGNVFTRLNNIPYQQTAPTQNNKDDLKIAVLSETPTNYYSGWIYIIYSESNNTYTVQHIYMVIGDKNIVIK